MSSSTKSSIVSKCSRSSKNSYRWHKNAKRCKKSIANYNHNHNKPSFKSIHKSTMASSKLSKNCIKKKRRISITDHVDVHAATIDLSQLVTTDAGSTTEPYSTPSWSSENDEENNASIQSAVPVAPRSLVAQASSSENEARENEATDHSAGDTPESTVSSYDPENTDKENYRIQWSPVPSYDPNILEPRFLAVSAFGEKRWMKRNKVSAALIIQSFEHQNMEETMRFHQCRTETPISHNFNRPKIYGAKRLTPQQLEQLKEKLRLETLEL